MQTARSCLNSRRQFVLTQILGSLFVSAIKQKEMFGRTGDMYTTVFPVERGVVSDYDLMEKWWFTLSKPLSEARL